VKLAIAFSSKNRIELTRQSLARILPRKSDTVHIHWMDGSSTEEGRQLLYEKGCPVTMIHENVIGGPDVAITYSLTELLKSAENYTHITLLENDVLVDEDWFKPTMALFDYSRTEGLPIGAVSARSYVDRILIQRDGYCVLHNAGAGHLILSREAAQIILRNYRTGWWPENRAVFAQLSGLDIGKWAAFHHNEQMITADWSFDTILAAHGLATVALTPSKATMIGQELTLEQQGLKLVTADVDGCAATTRRSRCSGATCWRFNPASSTSARSTSTCAILKGSSLFPHHAARHGGKFRGDWKTRWMQAFGPFCYESQGEARFSMPVFGPVRLPRRRRTSQAARPRDRLSDRQRLLDHRPDRYPVGPARQAVRRDRDRVRQGRLPCRDRDHAGPGGA
jgi:hypothetical protein